MRSNEAHASTVAREIVHPLGDASFARSYGPCTSILTMHPAEQSAEWWGGRVGITVGQTRASGRKPTLGLKRTDGARLAACHRSRKGEGVTCREKEGGRGLRPCEDTRARVWLPARRSAVAEVGRRRLVSNTLGTRAPKRAVRVE
jgi:hypothetical protein